MIQLCMITATPANVEIPVDGITNGAITNDDGHGWAVASAQYGLQVGKSMDFDKALETYRDAREAHGDDSIGLFHSRFGTHGEYGEYNIHPFYASDTTVVAHNGILPSQWHPSARDRRSDTRIFVDRVLTEYVGGPSGVPSRRGSRRLGTMIGSGNKLAFLSVASGAPRLRIVNAWVGVHHEGSWFSNTGYKKSSWGTYGRGVTRYWDSYSYGAAGYTGGAYNAGSCGTTKTESKRLVTVNPTWEDPAYYEGECEVCLAVGTVNLDTDVCIACKTCTSCWSSEQFCECPWAAYMKEREAERDAIEAALAEEKIQRLDPPLALPVGSHGIDDSLWQQD